MSILTKLNDSFNYLANKIKSLELSPSSNNTNSHYELADSFSLKHYGSGIWYNTPYTFLNDGILEVITTRTSTGDDYKIWIFINPIFDSTKTIMYQFPAGTTNSIGVRLLIFKGDILTRIQFPSNSASGLINVYYLK